MSMVVGLKDDSVKCVAIESTKELLFCFPH